MKITKLEHSGLVIEKDGQNLVFDPVEFTGIIPKIENVAAVVITHKHGDHFQPEILARIINNNPGVKVFTTGDTAPLITNAAIVKAGDSYAVGNFKLDFFGKDHATIVPGQIPCENIGVVVDDILVNPGDSFDLPSIQGKILFTPISAPWLKIVESMDYVEKARPQIVIPVHDALLSELGEQISSNWVKKVCETVSATSVELKPGEDLTI